MMLGDMGCLQPVPPGHQAQPQPQPPEAAGSASPGLPDVPAAQLDQHWQRLMENQQADLDRRRREAQELHDYTQARERARWQVQRDSQEEMQRHINPE